MMQIIALYRRGIADSMYLTDYNSELTSGVNALARDPFGLIVIENFIVPTAIK